eukprot:3332817-Prymnesium_polylepis.1
MVPLALALCCVSGWLARPSIMSTRAMSLHSPPLRMSADGAMALSTAPAAVVDGDELPPEGDKRPAWQHLLAPEAATGIAGLSTWALHNSWGLTPVAASAAVGVVSGVLLPAPLAVAAYCGSFAGMATTTVVSSLP